MDCFGLKTLRSIKKNCKLKTSISYKIGIGDDHIEIAIKKNCKLKTSVVIKYRIIILVSKFININNAVIIQDIL